MEVGIEVRNGGGVGGEVRNGGVGVGVGVYRNPLNTYIINKKWHNSTYM